MSKNFPFEKLIMSQNNIFQHAMLDLLGQSRRQYLGFKKKILVVELTIFGFANISGLQIKIIGKY